MQQQAAGIHNLQQQQGRIINPEEEEVENEAFNADIGGFGNDGGNNNGGPANAGLAMGGIPNNDELGHGGNVCLTTIRCEPLCEQFGKMRPPEFEGSTRCRGIAILYRNNTGIYGIKRSRKGYMCNFCAQEGSQVLVGIGESQDKCTNDDVGRLCLGI